jgi:methionine-R-sulfoxide reductase
MFLLAALLCNYGRGKCLIDIGTEGTLLFDATEKYESGTGWPSFTQPIKENVIAYHFDGPSFLKRIETVCNTCNAHLGHVFPDGPEPSGLRYCMNAVALKKVSKT